MSKPFPDFTVPFHYFSCVPPQESVKITGRVLGVSLHHSLVLGKASPSPLPCFGNVSVVGACEDDAVIGMKFKWYKAAFFKQLTNICALSHW